MMGFSGGKYCEPLDLKDLTVEIDSTLRIPRPMGPINRGLQQCRNLAFSELVYLITEPSIAHCSENRVTVQPFYQALPLPSLSFLTKVSDVKCVLANVSLVQSFFPPSRSSFSCPWAFFHFVNFFVNIFFINLFICHRFLIGWGGRGATHGRGG